MYKENPNILFNPARFICLLFDDNAEDDCVHREVTECVDDALVGDLRSIRRIEQITRPAHLVAHAHEDAFDHRNAEVFARTEVVKRIRGARIVGALARGELVEICCDLTES